MDRVTTLPPPDAPELRAPSGPLAEHVRPGVWHPFTPMSAHRGETVPEIVSGDGFFLKDAAGREYFDGISSLWCNVHGHRVPEIDAAIADQLGRIAHTTLLGLENDLANDYAARLAAILPGDLGHVFYSDSGSTAVEAAAKIAYQYHRQKPDPEPRRDRFATVGHAYHGDTVGAVSLGGIGRFHAVYRDLVFEKREVPSPAAAAKPAALGHLSDAEWADHAVAAAEELFATEGDRLAAFVCEPLVQGAAGMLVHPPGYLRRLRELTEAAGALLIVDEVATGFGRTGRMFACEHEDIAPDLICLAKGITGGYLPLAATVATGEVFSAFLGDPLEGRTFYHGHTYTGNALACAAALASLDLFESGDVLSNANRSAAVLERRLAELDGRDHVHDIRRRGLMTGIELRDADGEPFPARLRLGHRVTLAARRHGLILRPLGDVVVLMPAPAMPPELVDALCDRAFAAIADALDSRDRPLADLLA